MPSEAWFSNYGLLTMKIKCSKRPSSASTQALQKADYWDPAFFHYSDFLFNFSVIRNLNISV
jgi:hypothetical protein